MKSLRQQENKFSGDPAVRKIRSYSELRTGWGYGVGEQFSSFTIANAISLYVLANKMGLRGDSSPIPNGGINLFFFLKNYHPDSLQIAINPDRSVDAEWQRGKGQNYEIIEELENIDHSGIIDILNKFKCASLVYFPSKPTIGRTNGFPVIASLIPQAVAASLLLTFGVLGTPLAVTSANMLNNTTTTLQVTL